MDTFQHIIEDIMKRHRDLLSMTGAPANRIKILNDLKTELKIVRDTWLEMHPGTTVKPDLSNIQHMS